MTGKSAAVKLSSVPQYLLEALIRSGIDPASDGNKKDLSAIDLLSAYHKLNKSCPENSESEASLASLCFLKEMIRDLFIYLYGTNQNKLANRMRHEIETASPSSPSSWYSWRVGGGGLGKELKNIPEKVYSLPNVQCILQKGILVSIDENFPTKTLINIRFKLTDKTITYTDSDPDSLRNIPIVLGNYRLKEIRFENSLFDSGDYVVHAPMIKAVYVDNTGNTLPVILGGWIFETSD